MSSPGSLGLSRAIAALAVAIVLVWSLLSGVPTGVGAETRVFGLTVVVAVVCTGLLVRSAPLGLWSGGPMFFVVLVLFHVPLVAFSLAGADIPGDDVDYFSLWFTPNGQVLRAVWLVAQALLAFTLGYVLLGRRRPTGSGPAVQALDDEAGRARAQTEAAMTLTGTVIVVVTVAYVLGTIALVEPGLLLGQGGKRLYDATVAANPSLTAGITFTLSGMSLVVAGRRSSVRTVGLVFFGVFAASTLVMGSRSSALYALVGLVVVLARLRPMPRQVIAVLVVVTGLVVVSSVERIRDDGLADTSVGEMLGSPLAATVEMGATLRPVVETVSWVDQGEAHRHGMTFAVGTIRFVELLAGVDREYSAVDPRLVGTLLRDRVEHYAIGYSIVAESFLNFGTTGSALLFVAFGMTFGRWDRRGLGRPVDAAVYGVVFSALLATVRSTSTTTVTTILLGLAAVVFSIWLGSIRHRSAERAVQQAADRAARLPATATATASEPVPAVAAP